MQRTWYHWLVLLFAEQGVFHLTLQGIQSDIFRPHLLWTFADDKLTQHGIPANLLN